MSITITDPTTPADQGQHLPVALWKAYKWHRGRNEKSRIAASIALDELGYTSQRAREPLTELLVGREQSRGLGSTPEEQEEEIALESAELEEGGPVSPAEPEPGSLGAIQADAREQLETLREQRARLAPEALTDASAKADMKVLEDEIRAAETALDLVEVARGETGRREREASEAAALAVREQGEAEAAKLQPQIALAAQRVDTAAGVFAEAATAFQELKELQAGAVGRSGRGSEATRGRSFRRREVAAALYVALREHNLGDVVEKFSGDNRDTPLASGEPKEWS